MTRSSYINEQKYHGDFVRKCLAKSLFIPAFHRDAKGMAKAVHDELVNILVDHGGYEKMAAIMELNTWAQEKRYLRDLV
jgi:hypothetical protein